MEKFKRLLLSVGAKTFVTYYDVFEANKSSDSREEIEDALRKQGIWKERSVSTKARSGKRIFEMNKETDALEYIACEAKRVDDKVKGKAKEILKSKGIGELELILKHL
jgi:hypothetical protein